MADGGLDYLAAVQDLLPGGELKGNEYWLRCPFHAEREPSFSVNIEKGAYFCFSCRTKGNFRQLVEALGFTWGEVLERYGSGNGRPRSGVKKCHKKAPNWERIWEQADPNGQVALRYLQNRGLPVERLPEFFREYRTVDGKILLLVKLIDRSGRTCGLQRIFLNPNGQKAPEGKRSWPASRLKNSFALLGCKPEKLDQAEILGVCEGPETALAVHLATGWPTLIAISASNLPAIDYPKQARIIFFSDKDLSKAGEREALKAIKKLRARGQKATLILPPGEIPANQKSLDFLDIFNQQGPEAIRKLAGKALQELEGQASKEIRFSPDHKYCLKGAAVWRCRDGEPEKRLANFTAYIIDDFCLDFGNGETQRFYQLEAKINGKTKTFWIKASKLASSSWVDEFLGSEARLAPGTTTAGHLADAIKAFSAPRKRTEPARSGWTQEKGRWRFRLPGPLAREVLGLGGHPYELLENPDPSKAREAASLLLEVAPAETITGALGAALFAPLSFFLRRVRLAQGVGFYLCGKTGHGKTTLARLILALYGPKWVFEGDLPVVFNSTNNYLQLVGFYWAYLPLVIDDLHPPRSTDERRHLTEVFSKILRTAANLSYRGRLADASSLQAARFFAATPLFTGEVTLSLLSSEATRLIQVSLEQPLDWETVSRLQEAPESLAALGTLWIKWLERQSPSLVERLKPEIARHRKELVGLPPRIRDNFTALKVTFGFFLDFLEDLGADSSDWWEAVRVGLSRLMGKAKEVSQQTDPAELFKSVFSELQASGTLVLPYSTEIQETREIHGVTLEEGKFFVFPRKVLAAINDFLARSGLPLLPPERDLWKLLEGVGIAEKPKTYHVPGLGKAWGRTIYLKEEKQKAAR